MKGSEYVVECLLREGVDTVLTVSATNIYPLLQELVKKGIRVINAKLELSAAFMASVYSRVKRKPGVLIVTAGPGLIGAASPIAGAMVEGDPLIVVSTIPPWKGDRTTHLHQLPEKGTQKDLLRPITKSQYVVEKFAWIPWTLSQAFSEAKSGKPGPVYVELPMELLDEEGQFLNYEVGEVHTPSPPPRLVELVVDLLLSAKSPAIIAGRGVHLSDARTELIKAVELLGAPVATTVMAKGLVPPQHPLYAGVTAGKLGNMTAQTIIKGADLVLALGNRFSEMGTGRYSLELQGQLVQVNVDYGEMGKAFKPDVTVVSDAKIFLADLLRELVDRNVKPRSATVSRISELWRTELEELKQYYTFNGDAIESWEVIKAIGECASKDAFIIGDVGAHRIETFLMPIPTPGAYITTTSYVSMGLAVPGAVVTSIAFPKRQVIGIVGDGGFLMTGLETATAVEHKSAPVIVVFNDSLYRVLKIYARSRGHSDVESLYKLPKVNFAQLANALGAKGIIIEKRQKLYPLLEEALKWKKGPVVVDVRINPDGVPIPLQRLYGR